MTRHIKRQTSSAKGKCTLIFHYLIAVLSIASLCSLITQPAFAQEAKLSFTERLKAKAEAAALLRDLDPRKLNQEQLRKIAEALYLGIEYGNQAKTDEVAGFEFAHQKAAYDWGFRVGDPKTVRLVRLYWEGVQLGVFGAGDLQQVYGEKTEGWASLEAMVGGNGKEYDIDEAYIDDIFDDVQIAVDGADAAERGEESDFESYAKRFE